MKTVNASAILVDPLPYDWVTKHIEVCGRTCYKSEDKITETSAVDFIRNIIKRGHEAVIEHASATILFTCDRGVSHEIVRHRVASYCQESTRYCNYSDDKFEGRISLIPPQGITKGTPAYTMWLRSMRTAEVAYFDLLDDGCSPQVARSVLPNSLKTEVIMTANMREWRHFLRLRCSKAAHPDMRYVARQALMTLYEYYPVLFEDIYKEVMLDE